MAGPVSGYEIEAQISGDCKRGGWITFVFIIATLLGISVTSYVWVLNLIVFLIEEYNIKNIAAAQISNIVNGCLSMLHVVSAILADSFFRNIPGIFLLTLNSSFDNLRPRVCETGSILCQSPSKLHLGILSYTQALVTDRGLGSISKVPAGSLQVIVLISSCVFLVLNNWTINPMYQKITRKQLTPLQQVGISQVLNILSMAISAIMEAKRLKTVENEHLMSVLWLFPPLVIVGIGDAFHYMANVAVLYGEFPESLRNTATSVTSVVIGISFYLSTAVINLIQRTTTWLPDDINHGRVDNVYWALVIGGVLNLGYFLVCYWCSTYRNF